MTNRKVTEIVQAAVVGLGASVVGGIIVSWSAIALLGEESGYLFFALGCIAFVAVAEFWAAQKPTAQERG